MCWRHPVRRPNQRGGGNRLGRLSHILSLHSCTPYVLQGAIPYANKCSELAFPTSPTNAKWDGCRDLQLSHLGENGSESRTGASDRTIRGSKKKKKISSSTTDEYLYYTAPPDPEPEKVRKGVMWLDTCGAQRSAKDRSKESADNWAILTDTSDQREHPSFVRGPSHVAAWSMATFRSGTSQQANFVPELAEIVAERGNKSS